MSFNRAIEPWLLGKGRRAGGRRGEEAAEAGCAEGVEEVAALRDSEVAAGLAALSGPMNL